MEAEEQVTHFHGRTYHFEHQQSKVQNSNSNPRILFNARGNPYVEGDPNLGYSMQDIRPRNSNSGRANDPYPSKLGLSPNLFLHLIYHQIIYPILNLTLHKPNNTNPTPEPTLINPKLTNPIPDPVLDRISLNLKIGRLFSSHRVHLWL